MSRWPPPRSVRPAGRGSGALALVRESLHPLTGAPGDHAKLMELIGDKSVVLIGEASHGTHDFYRERAQITRLLIEHKGFNAVAIEGDWPDAHRVHSFVTASGSQDDMDAVADAAADA